MQAELVEHDVEGAEVATMTPEHIVHIKWCSAEPVRDRHHLGGCHEQENGLRVDEAPDQPGAGDAVHLGSRARNPHRAALGVRWRNMVGLDEQTFGGGPGLESAFQRLGLDSGVAQPGDTLTEFAALLASDNGVSDAGVFGGPGRDGAEIAANGARKHPGIGRVVGVGTHVDERRRVGQADEASELGRGEHGGWRHGRPLLRKGVLDAILRLPPHGVIAGIPLALRCGKVAPGVKRDNGAEQTVPIG